MLIAMLCTLARVLDGAAPDTRLIDAVRRVDANAVRRLSNRRSTSTPPSRTVRPRFTGPRTATMWPSPTCSFEPARRWTPPTRAVSRRLGWPPQRQPRDGRAAAEGRRQPGRRARKPRPLGRAHGNVEVMKLLLAHGGDANAKEPARGQTALMWAVAEKHPGVARVLIDQGADVKAKTIPVRTAGGGRGGGIGGLAAAWVAGPTGRTASRRCSSPCGPAISRRSGCSPTPARTSTMPRPTD